MKIGLSKFLKKSLLFVLIITVASCERENDIEQNHTSHWKVNDISKKVLEDKTDFDDFVKKLDDVKSLKSKNNTENEIYDFYIDYSTIREIELESKTSYTFRILREDNSETSFENLVAIVQNQQIVSAYLFKYTPTIAIELVHDHNTTTFQGNVGVTKLNLNSLDINLQQRTTCTDVWVAYCSWSSPHVAGPDCFMWNDILNDGRISYSLETICEDDGFLEPPIGTEGGGSGSGSSGGPGEGNNIPTTPITPTGSDGENVTASELIENLNITNQLKIDWLNNIENSIEANNFYSLCISNNWSREVVNFTKSAISLEVILSTELEIIKTGMTPEEIPNCCPDYGDYENDKIINEYGIKPIQQAIDGTFNIIVSSVSIFKSDEWVGKRIRRIMTEIGVSVPSDISNSHLAAIFKIRKRNGVVIVEYRKGVLSTMLDLGLNTLDMLAFLTPSKGGGAFLATKIGGISVLKMNEHFRNIWLNNDRIDGVINFLKSKAKFDLTGTGKYKDVGGHHPLAKKSFENDKFYKYREAFSVPSSKLDQAAGIPNVHSKITGQQNMLYTNFAKSKKVLTLDKMAEIEIEAMKNVGIPEDIATGWVIKALENLKAQGVKALTHIPWNGIN